MEDVLSVAKLPLAIWLSGKGSSPLLDGKGSSHSQTPACCSVALHHGGRAAKGAARGPGGILHPAYGSVLGFRCCGGGPGLYVLLHCSLWAE